jgi:hypothetical protein
MLAALLSFIGGQIAVQVLVQLLLDFLAIHD